MARPSYVGTFIPGLIRKGYTPTRAARELRNAGHTFADEMFRRLWAETQVYISRREGLPEININRRPTPDQYVVTTRPKARGYHYPVNIASHDPETGEISFHAWGVRSQKLISYKTAMALAIQSWADSQDGGRGTPPGRAVGAIPEPVQLFVGPEDTIGT